MALRIAATVIVMRANPCSITSKVEQRVIIFCSFRKLFNWPISAESSQLCGTGLKTAVIKSWR